MSDAVVLAAGAVVWRRDASGGVEVALVHRPRYDDWSLPKGKLDEVEPLAAAAVREVAEETGQRVVLGPQLGSAHYEVEAGPKTVRYWAARASGGEFTPDDEVDELRWLPIGKADRLLDYEHERGVLARFAALPPTRTLLLVRHAKAGKRSEWHGPDELRPLTDAGWRQAAKLRRLLPLFGPERLHAARRTRCEQTVQPVADDLGVRVQGEPLLSEEGYWPDPEAGLARVCEIVTETDVAAVICSQGGVIPDLIDTLTTAAGLPLRAVASRKSSVWVLSFTTEGPGGPDLVAADYYSDPSE